MSVKKRSISIQLKIVSLVLLILVGATAVSVYVAVSNQRAGLLEATQRTLSINTALLNLTIRNLMLSGEAPTVVRTMASFKDIEEFKDIALYRADGTAAFSDYSTIDKVNKYQSKLHFQQTPRAEARTENEPEFISAVDGKTPIQIESSQTQEVAYFFPVLNAPDCRACHGYGGFVRGVLHFRLSIASIYDQIRSARNILTALLASIGFAISGLLILMLNRVIVAPVLAIGSTARIVGQGNLEARVGVRSRDELGDLASTLNEMISGLKERNELAIRNRVIDATNMENRKYLDSIQEGLLLINREFVISDQYSRYLEKLFGTDRIAGKSLLDFVYPDVSAHEAERGELSRFLDVLFTNTVAEMEMILSINPLKEKTLRVRDDGRSREIIVDAMFHRVFAGETVDNMMVIFEDRTDIAHVRRELEVERVRAESELDHIAAILRAGPEAFQEFADQAEQAVASLESEMSSVGRGGDSAALMRTMHSLKGAARYLNFGNIEKAAHHVEEILSGFGQGKSGASEDALSLLRAQMEVIRGEVVAVRALNERFRKFAVAETASPVTESLRSFKEMADGIAAQLGKEISFRVIGSPEDAGLLARIRDPLIHLVRNAIDHGIEDGMERLSLGKPRVGSVSIGFRKEGGVTRVSVADDGRGIDFDAVQRRAEELGLIDAGEQPDQAALLGILFSPRFSSKRSATEISGRGVGLDAVRDSIKNLGGRIFVETRKGIGTTVTLSIPA